jgi:hypothetical protein
MRPKKENNKLISFIADWLYSHVRNHYVIYKHSRDPMNVDKKATKSK